MFFHQMGFNISCFCMWVIMSIKKKRKKCMIQLTIIVSSLVTTVCAYQVNCVSMLRMNIVLMTLQIIHISESTGTVLASIGTWTSLGFVVVIIIIKTSIITPLLSLSLSPPPLILILTTTHSLKFTIDISIGSTTTYLNNSPSTNTYIETYIHTHTHTTTISIPPPPPPSSSLS